MFILLFLKMNAQTVFWMEDFGTGCNQGQMANGTIATPTNGAWAVTNTGPNDPYANEWYISSTSSEMFVNSCDQSCMTNSTINNRSLHISNAYIYTLSLSADQGAAYYEGTCTFSFCANTYKRVESPTINCTGYSNLSLSFDYIQGGTNGMDYTTLMYFDGTNWSSLGTISSTNNSSCGSMGYWTNYTIILPASANNNPNVKIGFNWQNVNDGIAADPSFSVDNINLSVATSNVLLTNEPSIKIFPNPTHDLLKISTNNKEIKDITIKDITGRVNYQTKVTDSDNIDISHLKNGIYFLEINTHSGVERHSIIKQ